LKPLIQEKTILFISLHPTNYPPILSKKTGEESAFSRSIIATNLATPALIG
jgi:hypothetical protein